MSTRQYSPGEIADVSAAIAAAADWLRKTQTVELVAVGHRVAHGGPEFDRAVLARLKQYNVLAPLHQGRKADRSGYASELVDLRWEQIDLEHETERIEELLVTMVEPPHHRLLHSKSSQSDRITVRGNQHRLPQQKLPFAYIEMLRERLRLPT